MAQPNSSVTQYEDYVMSLTQPLGLDYHIIEAIMMQESHGQGLDVMQVSGGKYASTYNSNPSPYTSIQAGVHEFYDDYTQANYNLPEALAMYNMGSGILNYFNTHGGYSEQNMIDFSNQQKKQLGWSGYGDPKYVSNVLQYYQSPDGQVANSNPNPVAAVLPVVQNSISGLSEGAYQSLKTLDDFMSFQGIDMKTVTNPGSFFIQNSQAILSRGLIVLIGLILFIFALVAFVGTDNIKTIAKAAATA